MARSDKRMLVIIPTYNEIDNIQRILPAVLDTEKALEVLVVDDNSPDGTGAAVKQMMKKTKRIHLMERAGKSGLGKAYVAGFRYALENGYDYIFEMDADFSHNPKDLPRFIDEMDDADLVIGSRYVQGVTVVNWPVSRLLLSYSANLYIRFVTRIPVKDATAGFRCYKREVIENINLNLIHSDGYAFQVEMAYKAWRSGFRLKEIPVVFVDRTVGESKMSSGIIGEAAWLVWKLRIDDLFSKQ
jgi:dolichol-phosphate mannosyltransferase